MQRLLNSVVSSVPERRKGIQQVLVRGVSSFGCRFCPPIFPSVSLAGATKPPHPLLLSEWDPFPCELAPASNGLKRQKLNKINPKLDLTFPARMRLGVVQCLWWGSKRDPFEDVHIAPQESPSFILAFHKTSLGEHHTKLNMAPSRRK